jgi:transcriptional regulator with XRE-family HTH domain
MIKLLKMKSNFGKAIKRLREQKGYNQKDMAEVFNVSPNAVFNWENGSIPRLEKLEEIAEHFNTDMNTLFGFDIDTKSEKSELEKRLIQEGLKKKINNLTESQLETLISIIKNFKD